VSTTSTSQTVLDPSTWVYRTTTYAAPRYYEVAPEEWHEIDTSFEPAPGDTFSVQTAENAIVTKVPQDSSTDPVRLVEDGEFIEFFLHDAQGTPSVDGTVATVDLEEAGASVDLESIATGVKESIVLDSDPSGTTTFTYDLTMSPQLHPTLTDDGSIEVVDGQGQTSFFIQPPYMFDSAPEPATSHDLAYELALTSDELWTLTLDVPEQWLSDPLRRYPVTIDPTVTNTPSTDCWVNQEVPTASHCGANRLRVGADSSGLARRSLLTFDLSSIPADGIFLESNLELWLDASQTSHIDMAAYEVRLPSQAWTGAATWASPDGTASSNWTGGGPWSPSEAGEDPAVATLDLNGSASGWKSWNIVEALHWWLDEEGNANTGLLLKQGNENVTSVLQFLSNNNADTAKWPKLTVLYLDPEHAEDQEYGTMLLDATRACMVDEGLMSASESTAESLGTIDSSGSRLDPTGIDRRPLDEDCSIGATIQMDQVATGLSDAAVDDALQSWHADVLSGETQVSPNTAAPRAEVDPCGSNSNHPIPTGFGRGDWIRNMNIRQDMSGTEFIHRYCQSPFWNWSTDNCSRSPDSGYLYNFTWACRRHDWGWRNLKRGEGHYDGSNIWKEHNKAVSDNQFLEDTQQNCHNKWANGSHRWRACMGIAATYTHAVRTHGGWNTTQELRVRKLRL
jgi:hypothetical protein